MSFVRDNIIVEQALELAGNDLQGLLNAKQDTLVSGTNIKTINGNSLLGSGDLVIGGGLSWDNVVIVNDVNTQLPNPSGGTHTLLDNTAYYFSAETHTLTNSLTLGDGTVLIGFGKNTTILEFTGTGDMIVGNTVTWQIQELELKSTTRTCFNITNPSNKIGFLKYVDINGVLSVGTINGGGVFGDFVLTFGCVNGLLLSGTLGSVGITNSSFRATTGTASYGLKVDAGTTGNSFRLINNLFDCTATRTSLDIDASFAPTQGGVLFVNLFTGAGTRLIGINGNTPGWTVLKNQNQGIAGLFQGFLAILNSTFITSSSTQPTYASTGGTRLILPATDYTDLGTTMQASVRVAVTHSAGPNRLVYVHLYNRTTASFVTGANFTVTIPTANQIVIGVGPTLTLDPNTVYEVLIARDSSGGNPSVTIYNAEFNFKAY